MDYLRVVDYLRLFEERHPGKGLILVEQAAAILLFVGRFVPLKGIERLLEAVAAMDAPNNLQLLLIGGDSPDAFFVLATSDDDGETWSDPRLVVVERRGGGSIRA